MTKGKLVIVGIFHVLVVNNIIILRRKFLASCFLSHLIASSCDIMITRFTSSRLGCHDIPIFHTFSKPLLLFALKNGVSTPILLDDLFFPGFPFLPKIFLSSSHDGIQAHKPARIRCTISWTVKSGVRR